MAHDIISKEFAEQIAAAKPWHGVDRSELDKAMQEAHQETITAINEISQAINNPDLPHTGMDESAFRLPFGYMIRVSSNEDDQLIASGVMVCAGCVTEALQYANSYAAKDGITQYKVLLEAQTTNAGAYAATCIYCGMEF